MVKLMSNETEFDFKSVTEVFKKIEAYLYQEYGTDEYDLDMLGCGLKELVDAGTVTVNNCIAYLYVTEPLEYANQVVMDFFDSDVQKLAI